MEGLAGLGSDAYDAISYLWTPHQERAIADKAKKGQELFEQAIGSRGYMHEQANAIRDASCRDNSMDRDNHSFCPSCRRSGLWNPLKGRRYFLSVFGPRRWRLQLSLQEEILR